jgi:hypothetical protein
MPLLRGFIMANFKVVRNITVVNSRLITPVVREFGSQYTLLAKGEGLEEVGGNTTKDGSAWINSNATYPNGDAVPAIPMIDRSKRPVETELGEGSEIELAFRIVENKKGTYYNLAAIKVLKFVKPFSVFDVFDTDDTEGVLDAF